jgi:hypothetical protein
LREEKVFRELWLIRYWNSMDKARRLGFYGTVNTSECILEVFREFADLKMIPHLPVISK